VLRCALAPTVASCAATAAAAPPQGIVGTWERQSAYVRWALEALDAPPQQQQPQQQAPRGMQSGGARSACGRRCAADAPAGGSPAASPVHPLRQIYEADAAERRRLAATDDTALLESGAVELPLSSGTKHRRAPSLPPQLSALLCLELALSAACRFLCRYRALSEAPPLLACFRRRCRCRPSSLPD
jgi:hypothetical protein